MKEIIKDAESRMQKAQESFKHELQKIRTGRAHPGLLEHIMVEYYGNPTPLNQVANVSTEGARTLLVTPWDKSSIAIVEKAIRTSDLGLNPATSGDVIRVPLPQLSEERRKDLIRVVRDEAEKSRVVVRNIRRDANNEFKKQVKEKLMSEDDERKAEAEIQKLTDKCIEQIEKLVTAKEAELMEI